MGPFNMNPQQIIQMAMKQNPNLANNPRAQEYINILMSGDQQKGEELARNLCSSFNVSPEQGVQQAQQFFKQMFSK